MRIGVVAAGVGIPPVDQRSGGLCRGGAVEGDPHAGVNPPREDRKVVAHLLDVERPRLDHAGWASFIRSATVTDSSVEVIVPCNRSQKACAEQGVSAWVHSPGPPPSARQLTGASDPSRLRTMSAIEMAAGRRASA